MMMYTTNNTLFINVSMISTVENTDLPDRVIIYYLTKQQREFMNSALPLN